MTRKRFKEIDSESTVVGDGTTTDPTEEEKAWIDIMSSSAPELETRKKKISVCVLADIEEYNSDVVKFQYDGQHFVIKKPSNSLQIARARERSIMEALEALNAQHCICIGVVPIGKDFSNIPVEVIGLMASIAENFFFTPYL